MNAFTHIQIANLVNAALAVRFGIKLDKAGFIYGNIQPDLSPACVTHPHRILNYREAVTQEIMNLCAAEEISYRSFSRRLGNICHYISDFFCFVHNSRFTGSSLRHSAYEFMLQGYALKHNCLFRAARRREGVRVFRDVDSLLEDIFGAHADYMKLDCSFRNDVDHAVKMCVNLVSSIIVISPAISATPLTGLNILCHT